MANVEKLSIALPGEMVRSIKEAVDSGDYATTSEVVRDAMRSWTYQRRVVVTSTADLKKKIAEGIASLDRGEGIPAEEVFSRLEAKYAAMAKARKKAKRAKSR
jgi:antitoxin ParD1/3/4